MPLQPGKQGELVHVRTVQVHHTGVSQHGGGVGIELVPLLWVEDGDILGTHHLAQEAVLFVRPNSDIYIWLPFTLPK